MRTYDELMLSYALKKLTTIFEDFLFHTRQQALQRHIPASRVGADRHEVAQKLPRWLRRLSINTPLQVTQALLTQMSLSQETGNDIRFHAQVVLLDFLVEEHLAMDLVSYYCEMGRAGSEDEVRHNGS